MTLSDETWYNTGESVVQLTYKGPGACLTTMIWHCRKPLNQWQCSFQKKAALPLANQLAAASDHSRKTGSWVFLLGKLASGSEAPFKLSEVNLNCDDILSSLSNGGVRGMGLVKFIHVIQGYFRGTGTIIELLWSASVLNLVNMGYLIISVN